MCTFFPEVSKHAFFKYSITTAHTEVLSSHYEKRVHIQSFSRSVFSCILTKYKDLRCKSLYSVRIQENTDQKKSVFGQFSRSDSVIQPIRMTSIRSRPSHPIYLDMH